MTELQSRLWEMMKWFHSFCMENNITYYALGGTALGAVRHNGFIPWDDDIDVGMPREEYNRFIVLMSKKNVSTQYEIETPLQNKNFVYTFSKIYDTRTTLIENTRYKAKRGIYIDVFPLDGIGNTWEESLRNFKKIEKKLDFVRAKCCAVNKDKAFKRNVAIILARCIPEFICGWRTTIKNIEKEVSQRKYEECNYISNIAGAWRAKEIVEKKYLGDSRLCKFEDSYICVPENVEKYLTCLYGNYMELPPIEKRKSHHDYVYLNLNKGYKE